MLFLAQVPHLVVLAWMGIAIFAIEAITLVWNPAKDAAVPNLVPGRLEAANQLSLIATYGVAPVVAALTLAGMEPALSSVDANAGWSAGTTATVVALLLNAASRLATALVVFFGIREISGHGRRPGAAGGGAAAVPGRLEVHRPDPAGTRVGAGHPGRVRGRRHRGGDRPVLRQSLGGGNATFYLLFGLIFIGLGCGIGLGPWAIGELSRRRWFGMSIMLAASGVIVLALAVHLTVAVVGAVLVGAGAGMAFLSGVTLLGGEVDDEVRGRVFAFVHTSVRAVLMLAIALDRCAGRGRRLAGGRPRGRRDPDLLHPRPAAGRRGLRDSRRPVGVPADG